MATDDTKPTIEAEPLASRKPSIAMFLLVLLCIAGIVAAVVLYLNRRASTERREQAIRQIRVEASIQAEKERVAKADAEAQRIAEAQQQADAKRLEEARKQEAARRTEEARLLEESKREAETKRAAHEKKLADLIARSNGKLIELAPVHNLTAFSIDTASAAKLFKNYIETQCEVASSLPVDIASEDLIARNVDVKIVTLTLTTAAVSTSSPTSSAGTQLRLVTVTMLAEVRSAQTNKVLWSKELSGRETLLPIQFKDRTDTALIEQVMNTTLQELEPYQELRSVFD